MFFVCYSVLIVFLSCFKWLLFLEEDSTVKCAQCQGFLSLSGLSLEECVEIVMAVKKDSVYVYPF